MSRGGYFEDTEVFDDDQPMMPNPMSVDDLSMSGSGYKKSTGRRTSGIPRSTSLRSTSPRSASPRSASPRSGSPISRKQSISGSDSGYLQQPLAPSAVIDDMVAEEGFVSFDEEETPTATKSKWCSTKKMIVVILFLLFALLAAILVVVLKKDSGSDEAPTPTVADKTPLPVPETMTPTTITNTSTEQPTRAPHSGPFFSKTSQIAEFAGSTDIAIHGNLAFVAKGTEGLFVVNVSNPSNLQLLGSLVGISSEHVEVTGDGNTVVVTDTKYGGIHMIDVSTPSMPKRVSSFSVGSRDDNNRGKVLDIVLHEHTVYISDEATGLYIVDIVDASNPRQYKSLFGPSDGTPTDTYVSDNGIAYVLRAGVLSVVEITSKSVPLVISPPAEIYDRGVDISIRVSNDRKTTTAYIIDETGLLHIVDVTNPFQPVVGTSIDFTGNDDQKIIATGAVAPPNSAEIVPQSEESKSCSTVPTKNGTILISCLGQLQMIGEDAAGNMTVTILESSGVITFTVSGDKLFVIKSDGLSIFDWTNDDYDTTPTTSSVQSRDVKVLSDAATADDISHLKPVLIRLFEHLSNMDIDLSDYNLDQTDLDNTVSSKDLVTGLKALFQMTPEVERYFGLFDHLDGVPTLEGLAGIIQNNVPVSTDASNLNVDEIYAGTFDTFSNELVLKIQLKATSYKSSQQLFLIEQLHQTLGKIGQLTELFDFIGGTNTDVNIPDLTQKASFKATAFIDVAVGVNVSTLEASKQLSESELLDRAFIRVSSYEAGIEVVVDPLEFSFDKVSVKGGLCSLSMGAKPSNEALKYAASPKVFSLKQLDEKSLPSLLFGEVSPKAYATLDIELPTQFQDEIEPTSLTFTPIIELRDSNLLDGKLHPFDLDIDLNYFINNGLINKITDSLDNIVSDVTSMNSKSVDEDAALACRSLLKGIDERVQFTDMLTNYVTLLRKYRKMVNDYPADLKLDAAGLALAQSTKFQETLLTAMGFDATVTRFTDKLDHVQVYYNLATDVATADPDFDIEMLGWFLSVKPEHRLTRSNAHAILSILPDSVKQQYQQSNTLGYPMDVNGATFDPTAHLTDLTTILLGSGASETLTAVKLGKLLSEINPTLGNNNEFQLEMFELLKKRFPTVMSRYEVTNTVTFPTDLITNDPFDWRMYIQEVATVLGMGSSGAVSKPEDLNIVFGKTPTVQGFLSFVRNGFNDAFRGYFVSSSQPLFQFEGHIITKGESKLLMMELVMDFSIPNILSTTITNPALNASLGSIALSELTSSFETSFTNLNKDTTKIAADLLLDVEAGIDISKVWKPSSAMVEVPPVFVNVSKVEVIASVSTTGHSAPFEFGSDVNFNIVNASLDVKFNLTADIPKGNPVVVLSDAANMKYSLTAVFESVIATGSLSMVAPFQVPLLASPVVVSLTDVNTFDSQSSAILVVAAEDFPISMTVSKVVKTKTASTTTTTATVIVIDFKVTTDAGVVSFPIIVNLQTSFTADSLQKVLLQVTLKVPETCPMSVLGAVAQLVETDPKLLTCGGMSTVDGALANIESMVLDPCVLASQKPSSHPFFTMKMHITTALSMNNLVIEDLHLAVAGQLLPSSTAGAIPVITVDPVAWTGDIDASTVVFGIPCLVKASMNNSFGITGVEADCTIRNRFFTLSSQIGYTVDKCSTDNNGAAKLEIPSIGLKASGKISERKGCGIDNEPEYDVQLLGSDVPVQGVTLVGPSLALSQTAVKNASGDISRKWTGEASGSLTIGSHTKLSALMKFNESGITSFTANGDLVMDPVTASVDASVADGLISGSGTFNVALKNGAIPQMSAKFQHVSTYNSKNADSPLWAINGTLGSFDIFGVTLDSTNITLVGSYKDTSATADDVAWTGSVVSEGHFLDNSKARFRTSIVNNEFDSLFANITIDGKSIRFSGEAEITSEHEKNTCAAVEAEGELYITGLDGDKTINFESTSLYNRCATKAGEVTYSMEATVDTTVEVFPGLTVKDLAVSVETRLPTSSQIDSSWKASVEGTSNLFGITSHAAVTWEDGKVTDAHIATAFTTTNGLLSAKLDFDYVDDCSTASKGSSDFIIRLDGLDDLAISGEVSYNKCTGVTELSGGTIASWTGPSGTTYDGITITVISSDNGGDPDAKLATRDWSGVITGMSSSGFMAQLSFDTKNGTIDGMVTYEDENLSLMVAVGNTNCTGQGTVILKNLPDHIPAMEFEVSFSRPGCVEPAWTAEGSIRQLIIPFNGKNLVIDELTITVTNDANDNKKVQINGEFMSGDFAIMLSFGVSPMTEVTLVGEKRSVTPISISSFTSKWYSAGSSSPFVTNSADPAMQGSVTTTSLNNVRLEVIFHEKTISLTADGFIFGLSWNIVIGVKHEDLKWKFGAYAMTSNYGGRASAPELVDKVIDGLMPASFSISIANEKMTVQGNSIRKGLCIRIVLAESSSHIQQMLTSAPSDFQTQIKAAKQPAVSNGVSGFVLQADILSPKDITLFVMLSGNIKISEGVYFRTVGMAFRIQVVPEMGFMAEIDFTVGEGATQQVLTAGGFVGLDLAGTISVGLSLDSTKAWVNPFGINGVEVLFPLGIEMGISVTGVPTKFAFMGGMQIGSVYGKITIGVNLIDFTKTAFKGEIGGLSLRQLVVNVGDCNTCIPSELDDLIDGTALESLLGSFNPDPVNSVAIHAGAVAETIEAGINIEVKNLQFLGVLHIESGRFKISANGIDTGLQLAPVSWGPLQITDPKDETKGPGFDLVLSPSKQKFAVYGQITVLGMRTMLDLSIGSHQSYGKFSLMIAGLEVSAALVVQGKPGDADFLNTIEASMSFEYINQIIDKAGEYFQGLSDSAAAFLDEKQKKFDEAAAAVNAANAKLEEAKAEVASDLQAASDAVTKYRLEKQQATCPNKCTRGWLGIPNCWGVFTCWVTKQAASLLVVAEKALAAAEVVAVAAIEVAQGALTVAEAALQVASLALELAKIGMQKFTDLIAKYGSLTNLFSIQRLGFRSTLTSTTAALDFQADLVVLGKLINLEFSSELTFDLIFDVVMGSVKQVVL
eukprot:TRINITY_DN352_c0_g3_i1.p1 TRINITY_DN352_c0_g3~~TRINITY_DN352_c0_g3_i1.p1  ORF type:complete len:3042 (+),score=775.89 TRINITY_DN352_c0_g3_i1:45-9128(+)